MVKHLRICNLILISGVFFSSSAVADANNGEYLGFKLGETFTVTSGTASIKHITGATVYAVDPGRHPHHIDSISIFVSPKSSVIGSVFGEWYFSNPRAAKVFADRYLSVLGDKYSHWISRGRSLTDGDYQLWVDIEEKPPIVDYWPSHKKSRVAIGLIYAPDSIGRRDWMALVKSEIGNPKIVARE